MNEKLNKL